MKKKQVKKKKRVLHKNVTYCVYIIEEMFWKINTKPNK